MGVDSGWVDHVTAEKCCWSQSADLAQGGTACLPACRGVMPLHPAGSPNWGGGGRQSADLLTFELENHTVHYRWWAQLLSY